MSEPTGTEAPRRSGRGVRIALAISLALNLAIVGVVGGLALGMDRRGPNDTPRLHTLGLGPFAVALNREDRQALRTTLEGQRGPLSRERQSIGAALREVQRALRAEPFDRDAAEAALEASRAAAMRLQGAGHGAFLDHVEGMSPEARAELADNLGRLMRRLGGRPR